jgi:hypothetical protein
VRFAGEAFGRAQQVGQWRYVHRRNDEAAFSVPARVFDQLAERQQVLAHRVDARRLPQHMARAARLLLYVRIAEPDDR